MRASLASASRIFLFLFAVCIFSRLTILMTQVTTNASSSFFFSSSSSPADRVDWSFDGGRKVPRNKRNKISHEATCYTKSSFICIYRFYSCHRKNEHFLSLSFQVFGSSYFFLVLSFIFACSLSFERVDCSRCLSLSFSSSQWSPS